MRTAIELVAANAQRVRSAADLPNEPVPSPCIAICRMDPATEWCQGCFRTLEEIAGWSRMDDAGKRSIWALIEQRLEQQA
ncbi:MAG: DUF1289 domain-containing protein [Burkholderiales bacterium]|nr:DUF1289 domain-containing protein [Burkholderiales bacterium]